MFVLILSFFLSAANAQEKKINGVVMLKNDREVLDLVVVWVKGTNQGMVTGRDGQFDLNVNEGDTIEFSAKGYKSTELIVGAGSLYKAELESSHEAGRNNTLGVSALDPGRSRKQD